MMGEEDARGNMDGKRKDSIGWRRGLLASLLSLSFAPTAALADPIPLNPATHIPGGGSRITLRLRDVSVKDALQTISQQTHDSFLLDDSLAGGTVNMDFYQVPIDDIVDSIVQSNGLQVQKLGNSYIFYKQGHNPQLVIAGIPLHYANALTVAAEITAMLTGTGGSAGASGGTDKPTVSADAGTNTLIVMGPGATVGSIRQLVARLDVMLPSRLFKLNSLSPTDAIQLLQSTYFPTPPAGGTSGVTLTPTALPDTAVDFSKVVPGTLPTTTTNTLQIPASGPRFIPVDQENAILAIGTTQDLDLVGKLLAQIDVPPKQVLIHTEVVELDATDAETLGLNWEAKSKAFGLGMGINGGDNGFSMSTLANQAANLQLQINALVTSDKAKILANPSVLAMSDHSSVIDITDDIVESTQTQLSQTQFSTLATTTVNKGTSGITLEFTPRVANDGSILMDVHPKISFVKSQVYQDNNTNGNLLATLLSTREFKTQEIRVMNGQTIVIGGLIQDHVENTENKLPILGDIPFLGRIFQFQGQNTQRTEVKILITPEIIADTGTRVGEAP